MNKVLNKFKWLVGKWELAYLIFIVRTKEGKSKRGQGKG